MPVILQPVEYDTWLDPGLQDAEILQQLLRPYPAAMTAFAISLRVNNPRHDGPDCITPAAP
jgi:putative SOS response-associated peptidase YedK